jgi:hypothetical protein
MLTKHFRSELIDDGGFVRAHVIRYFIISLYCYHWLSIVSYSWNLSKSMRWPTPRYLTVRCRLNTNLCNKRDDINFLIVNFSFICNLCIWSGVYIFQNLWLLSWFPWWRVVANKKVTRSRVPSGYDEDITSEALRFPAWLG